MISERLGEFFYWLGCGFFNVGFTELLIRESTRLLVGEEVMILYDFEDLFFGGEVPESVRGEDEVTENGLDGDDIELWVMLDVWSSELSFGGFGDFIEILLFFEIVIA